MVFWREYVFGVGDWRRDIGDVVMRMLGLIERVVLGGSSVRLWFAIVEGYWEGSVVFCDSFGSML